MKQILLIILICLVVDFNLNQIEAQQNGELNEKSFKRGKSYLNNFHNDSSSSDLELSNNSNNNNVDKIQYLNVNGLPVLVQFTYVGPPKILPIATADSYPEGSTINLICTVSGGQRKGLTLAWKKDGNDLNNEQLFSPLNVVDQMDNVSIEKTGADISILRITNATHSNSGKFTCTANNPLGEDSTSVNIVINGEYKLV